MQTKILPLPPSSRRLVLFDGVCQFCNSSVNFIIDHDPLHRFCFSPLQSALGVAMLQRFGLAEQRIDSVVLIENQRCYIKSTAALRIARRLQSPWPALALFIMIPALLRDAAYDVIARNRYRWFGRLDQCRMPTPELRERFVDVGSFQGT